MRIKFLVCGKGGKVYNNTKKKVHLFSAVVAHNIYLRTTDIL
jgi:hypothetical protein